MNFITWNVNGLRACLNKGFMDFFCERDADFFCIQETKMQKEQAEVVTPGYFQFWNSAEKKGYSGTAVFAKKSPVNVSYDVPIEKHSKEGRVITLELDKFFLVNCYTPNAKRGLGRLGYRMEWEDDFRGFLMRLDEVKPVILCGDLNVAHKEIDLKNPQSNHKNAGFTDEEREKMSVLLASGFSDAFRKLYPDKTSCYTWWSYMFNARANNAGWRIDYFIVSDRFMPLVSDVIIHDKVLGSDHCPVELVIKG